MSKFVSRLRRRRVPVTVNVKTYAGATLYSNLTATRTEKLMEPVKTEDGVMMLDVVIFYFEQVNGVLPAIVDEHRITDTSTSLIYEVLTSQNQGGEGNRLKLTTRRYN